MPEVDLFTFSIVDRRPAILLTLEWIEVGCLLELLLSDETHLEALLQFTNELVKFTLRLEVLLVLLEELDNLCEQRRAQG